jgi:hypothetical protein
MWAPDPASDPCKACDLTSSSVVSSDVTDGSAGGLTNEPSLSDDCRVITLVGEPMGADMRRAIAASLVAAGLVLSGCADTGEDDEGDDTTSTVEEDSEDDGDEESEDD